MKAITAALCAASLLVSAGAIGQDKKAGKGVTLNAAQKKQAQARSRDCEREADRRKMNPELRKQFLQSCLRKR